MLRIDQPSKVTFSREPERTILTYLSSLSRPLSDQNALGIIEQYTRTNYAEFMNLLATELATEGKDPFLRQLAGQTIRNNLYGKEETSQAEKHIRWKQTPVEARNPVKNALLAAMRSPLRQARHAAAQASSEIATLELPSNLWPEFLPAMLEYVTAEAHSEGTKVAALECLGYTCERIGEVDGLPTLAPDVTNAMLTTIVDGMQTSRSDPVRLAACKALRNSLVFTASNFEKKAERDAIINSICEATLSSDANIRKEAFGCIHTVAYLYYDKLQDYMSVFYELTIKAIRSDEESVATEALELWNVLAEIEEDLIIEEAEGTNAQPCHRYTFSILEHFVPILLEATAKQPEDFDLDADQYSLSVAAQTCLQLMAQTTGDAITPFVMPFVTNNIKNTNWRYREAATMAFAAILEGASEQSVKATVEQAISVLVAALNDNVEMVKHSTLWTLSKICELHSNSIPAAELPSLVNALMGKLAPPNSPHVAQQAAHALFKLASAFQGDPMGQERGSNLLSPFLQSLLQQLMAAADRTDALGESGLKLAAFEAMQEFIRVSAPDGKPLLLQLLPAINERLQMSFQMQTCETKDELQGHLSATLLTLCRKLDREDIAPLSDALMSNFLRVLQTPSHQSQEEALGAIAAVADATEEAFEVSWTSHVQSLLCPESIIDVQITAEIHAKSEGSFACWTPTIRLASSVHHCSRSGRRYLSWNR
jgi:importin subunit beta-1